MKPTKGGLLVIWAVAAAVTAALIGIYRMSRGMTVPVSPVNVILTLPVIAVVLVALAYPIYKYRKGLLDLAKAGAGKGSGNGSSGSGTSVSAAGLHRPKRLDPFYAVRVLLLAKASAIASAIFIGWHLGLVVLQLSTPVISPKIFGNVTGLLGSVVCLVVALIVERICRIPDSGSNDAAAAAGSGEATPA